MLKEAVDALALSAGDIVIDCTLGAGGHTEAMLAKVGNTGLVIGIDRDDTALALANLRLASAVAEGRLKLVKARFSDVKQVAEAAGVAGRVAGVLADIGVSSMHLDQADRGFSFMREGPLDMRMDRTSGQSAAELIAEADVAELTKLFRDYGEDPKARQIAQRIVKDRAIRPITTTTELAALVADASHYKDHSRKHPATRVFQALRIAVNDELGELETLLKDGFGVLRTGGRLAIIAFHSLEDRLVKESFLSHTGKRERAAIPRGIPLKEEHIRSMHASTGEIIKPFPGMSSEEEIRRNPRARSAKLRVVAKLSPSST